MTSTTDYIQTIDFCGTRWECTNFPEYGVVYRRTGDEEWYFIDYMRPVLIEAFITAVGIAVEDVPEISDGD